MMSDQRASLFAAHSAAEGLKARAAADEATRQLSRGSATPWISMLAKDYKEHLLAPPTGLHWPIGSPRQASELDARASLLTPLQPVSPPPCRRRVTSAGEGLVRRGAGCGAKSRVVLTARAARASPRAQRATLSGRPLRASRSRPDQCAAQAAVADGGARTRPGLGVRISSRHRDRESRARAARVAEPQTPVGRRDRRCDSPSPPTPRCHFPVAQQVEMPRTHALIAPPMTPSRQATLVAKRRAPTARRGTAATAQCSCSPTAVSLLRAAPWQRSCPTTR